MADVQFQPQNAYGLFSPDQWSNQFSLYNNQPMPWPSQYAGWPTDALGNPIRPPQGTTINTSPIQQPAQTAPARPQPSGMTDQQAWLLAQQTGGSGVQGSGRGTTSPQGALDIYNQLMKPMGPQRQQQAAAPAAAAGPSNIMSSPDALSLLANPGRVTTQGAQPGVAAPNQPGGGVLQAFLANWNPAQSGPGAGFQQNFARTLRGFGY